MMKTKVAKLIKQKMQNLEKQKHVILVEMGYEAHQVGTDTALFVGHFTKMISAQKLCIICFALMAVNVHHNRQRLASNYLDQSVIAYHQE